MMNPAATSETGNYIEPVVFARRNVCTPLSILEGLMEPRSYEYPRGEEVEVGIVVTDTESVSSLPSTEPEDQKEGDCDSMVDVAGNLESNCGQSENGVLSEECEGPVLEVVAEDDLGPAMNSPRRPYVDGTLPDLLRSGSPLRRRVSSPVSNTLKEVRREVELGRRRSLKLKAQVERLQTQTDSNWSQHKQQVTDEVQGILRLLLPLTDMTPGQGDSSSGSSTLDTALSQLQQVARTLALNHTKQNSKDEDSAILQQALRDRDQAVSKKKAMEMELLNSKTEMMLLNNQLLEAVQHRLEISLELEAWKEDFQLLLQQQVLCQQQAAEQQAQKRGGLLGTLGRKTGKSSRPPPSPSPSRLSASASPAPAPTPAPTSTTTTPQTSPRAAAERDTPNRWRVKLRRGRTSRGAEEAAPAPAVESSRSQYSPHPVGGSRGGQFHTISLD
ncbi:bicaudal-D-related protein 2-like [Engraulis encrasicolus]|uniref:bicaudal-D-related protein 2-like n=1 Tax=Engraulis encrasicolus TaxID=184585 RepID=UPI002FD19B42